MLTTLYKPMHQRSNKICPENPLTKANQSCKRTKFVKFYINIDLNVSTHWRSSQECGPPAGHSCQERLCARTAAIILSRIINIPNIINIYILKNIYIKDALTLGGHICHVHREKNLYQIQIYTRKSTLWLTERDCTSFISPYKTDLINMISLCRTL